MYLHSLLQKCWCATLVAALAVGVGSCARNPVTGKTELQLVSERQEVRIGEQNYVPSRQSQGGDLSIEPELTAYVRSIGDKLAKVSDRPELPYEFVVLNNSTPNAWALPGGKIAVNRGLLTELRNEAELAAVLGHEIVHAAARHGAKAMERGLLMQVGIVGLGALAGDNDRGNLLVGAGAVGAQLISKKYGREAESEADRFGMIYMSRAGYDPRAAITLQETFVRLFNAEQTNWLQGLFASHPPSPERVADNKKTARQLPAAGTLGTDAYRAKTAVLERSRAAYAKLDAGRNALTQHDPALALTQADAALRIEPREALFYGLRGDALAMQDKFREAVNEYDAAIAHNNGYFQFYLQRGLLKRKLNDASARADLEQSVSLLPTATAYLALGEDALVRNDQDTARRYFAAASESDSETGRRATIELARLELGEHPEKYIAVEATRDDKNDLAVMIQNRSPLKLRNIKIAIAMFDFSGAILKQDSLTYSQMLVPRQTAIMATNIGPVATAGDMQRVRVKIFSAELAE